jgi:hypothetical protein
MRLPEDVVRDADVAQERVDRIVSAEERMQTGLEDITVAVAPRREFSAKDVPFFQDGGAAAGIG